MDLEDLLGCPIVVSFRGYDLNYVGLEDPDFYAEVWQRASALHLLGEDLWRRAVRRGCPADKPHALIPPAIDAGFFDPAGSERAATPGAPLRILSVGRLEWKKGYEDALVAVRKLVDRGIDCQYRILGDGDFLGAVAFARHQLGLEERVTFLGAGSRDEVRARDAEGRRPSPRGRLGRLLQRGARSPGHEASRGLHGRRRAAGERRERRHRHRRRRGETRRLSPTRWRPWPAIPTAGGAWGRPGAHGWRRGFDRKPRSRHSTDSMRTFCPAETRRGRPAEPRRPASR